MTNPVDPQSSIIRRIRVSKADSAYVYAILEASEGICAYTTIPHQSGDWHRDLELMVPTGCIEAVDRLIARLKDDCGGELHELKIENRLES